MKRIKWEGEKLELLKELYPIKTNKELCEIFGVINPNVFAETARRNGIVKNKVISSSKGNLQPLLEENNISYYWLGFIMADGYISKGGQLVVSLSNKDEDHLSKLANLLNTSIKNYPSSNKKGIQSKIAIQDKNLGIILRNKFEIIGKKTYNAPLLYKFIPKEYIIPFIIGFIDGDGSLSTKSIRIECYKTWINNLIFFGEYLKENYNINYRADINKNGYAGIYFTQKDSSLLKYIMLEYNIPFMKRKWNLLKN